MSTYQWLLFFHVTGAFLLLGGGVIASALNLAALRHERPSEIVLLFSLIRVAVAPILLGALLALVFGLWLVHEAGFGYGDTWVVLALVLFVVGNALGGIGGGETSTPPASHAGLPPRATRQVPSSAHGSATRSRSR